MSLEGVTHTGHFVIGCPVAHLGKDLSLPIDAVTDTETASGYDFFVEIEEIQLATVEDCLWKPFPVQWLPSMRLHDIISE